MPPLTASPHRTMNHADMERIEAQMKEVVVRPLQLADEVSYEKKMRERRQMERKRGRRTGVGSERTPMSFRMTT